MRARRTNLVVLAAASLCLGPAVASDTPDPCPATFAMRDGPGPAPRAAHGMAYDAARARTVVFGGVGDIFGTLNLGDTWGWDGERWTLLAATGPEPRRDGLLAYDAVRRRVVLFGGSDTELITGNRYFPETWEWDGSSWSIRAPTGPPGRTAQAMAYDARRGRIVLYGGDADHVPSPADVWEWDGTVWTRIASTGPNPGPRLSPLMTYDARRGQVVLFGGYDFAANQARNDTWEWDGAVWTRRDLAAPLPEVRNGAALAYDAGRGVVILFGGGDASETQLAGVWELDDAGWRLRESGPTPRAEPSLAYDAGRSRLVMFGGLTRAQGTFGDTWERTAPATTELLLPIALDVRTATAHFTTELALTNRGDRDTDVDIRYTASLGSGTGSAVERLAAGRQTVIADALAYLRGKGLSIPSADAGAQAGTLLVSFGCASARDAVSVTARTTTPTAEPLPVGNAGLAYGAPAPSAAASDALVIHGLRANATDRSNVAVYNASASPVTLKLTAVSGAGDRTRALIADALELGPYAWAQYSFGASGLGNGRVEVERVAGSGRFSSYGVVNNNVTNDGSFVFAVPKAAGAAAWIVPVLVETPRFLSELVLANSGDALVTLELAYRESLGPAASGTLALVLAAGEQRIIPSAVDFLRSSGLPLGAAGSASRAGALRIRVVSGPAAGVWFAARTAAALPGGGQFGLFTPALPADTTPVEEGTLYGLRADTTTRSNVAFVNAGAPGADDVVLSYQVVDGSAGLPKGDPTTLQLAPGEWRQVDGALALAGVASGWVRVRRLSGNVPWYAYGVLNDGGQPGERTGDGAYVPMAP